MKEGVEGTARVLPAANGAAAAEWNGVLTVEIGGRRSAAEGYPGALPATRQLDTGAPG